MSTDEPKITADAIGVASAVSRRLSRALDHRVVVDLLPDEAGFNICIHCEDTADVEAVAERIAPKGDA